MKSNNKPMYMVPKEERPYEKCISRGAGSLSDRELLAVILRSGSHGVSALELADRVLKACPFQKGLTGLFHLSYADLCGIRGIGKVKAIQLLCIGELSRRISSESAFPKIRFNNPDSIADYYMERLRHEEQEVVICMMLDTKNHFLGDAELTRGTVNQSLVSPRELFLKAMSFHAVNLILIHNHPSGDAMPSREDIRITRRILEAGDILGITLLDHLIIGDSCFTSLKGCGFMDPPVSGSACADG